MKILSIIAICLGVAIVALLLVILIRTLSFKPKPTLPLLEGEEEFDKEKVVTNLQKLVQCKTVSYKEAGLEDEKEFTKLIDMLPSLYPNVFSNCEFRRFPDRGLMFIWKGKAHQDISVLMAHYDVVPVEEEYWEKPPFSGIIENGILWGRGSIDTKVTFNGVLSSADHLIKKGFVPENDIYMCFSGGEEINGPGAVHMMEFFRDNHINVNLVVDEGGAVVRDIFPGVKQSCAMVGIAEKGMMNLQFSVKSAGGHASAPKPNSPLPKLAKAITKIETHPFPSHLISPVLSMYDTLGRYSSFLYRMIFSNLWLFRGILDLICRKGGGELNALSRTTVAFTKAEGSSAINVIPPSASFCTNLRLNPMDSTSSALSYIKKRVDDPSIDIEMLHGDEPSAISEVNCPQFEKLSKAIASTWKGCIVSPYLMIQCSDSKYYGEISKYVYKFSAQEMSSEEIHSIHGNNEKIRISQIQKAVEFYIRLIKQL